MRIRGSDLWLPPRLRRPQMMVGPTFFSGAVPGPNVVLLMHYDGNFVDSSPVGRTVSPIASAVTTNAQTKFGAESFGFNSTWYAETASSADFLFAARWWSVDFWLYIPAATSLATDNALVTLWKNGGQISWYIGLNAAGSVRFFQSQNGTTGDFFSITGDLTRDAWNHVAVWHHQPSSTVYGSINGSIGGSRALLGSLFASNAKLTIGSIDGPGAIMKTAYMDELRVCVDNIAYTNVNFTPETGAY